MTLYDIAVTTIDGKSIPMSTYKGRVLLIVNVASKCGFTPQYAGLDALYRKYERRGLTVAEVEECGCPEGGASKDRPFVPKTSDE